MGDLIIFGSLVGALVWIYKWGRSPSKPSTKIEMEPWNQNGVWPKIPKEEKRKSTWQEKVQQLQEKGKKKTAGSRDPLVNYYEKVLREAKKPQSKYEKYRGEYVVNNGLFTPAEAKFMKALQSALSDEYLISGKVRVADVLNVTRRDTDRQFYTYFNKVKAKHFDYVLCDKHTFAYVAAVELDDRSHQRQDRIERDNFLNEICKHTSFPLIRVQARYQYDIDEVRKVIDAEIGKDSGI